MRRVTTAWSTCMLDRKGHGSHASCPQTYMIPGAWSTDMHDYPAYDQINRHAAKLGACSTDMQENPAHV